VTVERVMPCWMKILICVAVVSLISGGGYYYFKKKIANNKLK
jgi:hypothetical protein